MRNPTETLKVVPDIIHVYRSASTIVPLITFATDIYAMIMEPNTARVDTQCDAVFRTFLPNRILMKKAASGNNGINT